ncbi:MAG: hydantoinase/oxoprolinase family protein [Desulfovibrionaceae bacterium]
MIQAGPNYIVGIDTGGTFTDAVVYAPGRGVVASAKRPTSHGDLEKGITAALQAALEDACISGADVACVGISTTLATNSVVESRGARVGLFQIGVHKPVRLPVVSVKFLQGGHLVSGKEEAPLDLPALVAGVRQFQDHVDAYAVAASGSCFNPAHEQVAAKAIAMVDPKPVSLAHQVSELPSHEERLATVALNAKLLPVMELFLDRLRSSLKRLGIDGQMFIVSGDASTMPPDQAAEKPLTTFAAGPAASALYGAHAAGLAGATDVLVVDVGGTTTDLVLVRGGEPAVRTGGSVIGGWETHVRAVELRTLGLGGDSHVRVASGQVEVGPRRVCPLALAGGPEPRKWLGREAQRLIFAASGAEKACEQSELMAYLLEHGPSTGNELIRALARNEVELERRLEDLSRLGLLVEAGFTPSDALHVLGLAAFGDAAAARQGAEALGHALGVDADTFARAVLERLRSGVEDALAEHVLRLEVGHDMAGLVRKRRELRLLGVDLRLKVPLVVLGAAGRELLDGLGERMGTETIFPEHGDVGNAAGAALAAAQADRNI